MYKGLYQKVLFKGEEYFYYKNQHWMIGAITPSIFKMKDNGFRYDLKREGVSFTNDELTFKQND